MTLIPDVHAITVWIRRIFGQGVVRGEVGNFKLGQLKWKLYSAKTIEEVVCCFCKAGSPLGARRAGWRYSRIRNKFGYKRSIQVCPQCFLKKGLIDADSSG